MPASERFLVVQTAFLGDVILTLPLIQALKRSSFTELVDVVVIPRAQPLLLNHPDIHRVVRFDKRGEDSGISGLLRIARQIRSPRYTAAIVPHRSLRSALLVYLAGIPLRIGFKNSTGSFLFTRRIPYERGIHETQRNLQLLPAAMQISGATELPALYPGNDDREHIHSFLTSLGITASDTLVGIAPGTVWMTKRWLKDRYSELCRLLAQEGVKVILIGGAEDRSLCNEIATGAGHSSVFNTAGRLTLLQSAYLIGRCGVLVCNDSAPLHIATAMKTPVVAIFGPTITAFGFGPIGPADTVVESIGLNCRPCSIHGGDRCPIGTFDCMKNISTNEVFHAVRRVRKRVAP